MTANELLKLLSSLPKSMKKVPLTITMTDEVAEDFNPDYICITAVADSNGKPQETILSFDGPTRKDD